MEPPSPRRSCPRSAELGRCQDGACNKPLDQPHLGATHTGRNESIAHPRVADEGGSSEALRRVACEERSDQVLRDVQWGVPWGVAAL